MDTNQFGYSVMDLDMPNLEQYKFYPQISGVEPSTTEANNTFSPMDYDICNAITNVVDLEAAGTSISVFQCKQDSKVSRLDELVKYIKMSPHNFSVSHNHDISGDLVDSLSSCMQERDIDCRPSQEKRDILLLETKCDNNMGRNLFADMQKEGLDRQAKQKKQEMVFLDDKHKFSVKNNSNTEKKQPSDVQGKGMKCWQKQMMVTPLCEDKYRFTEKNNVDKKQSSNVHDRSFDCRSEQKVKEPTLSKSSTFGKKRKRKIIRMKNMQLNMRCEWQNCDYCTSNLTHFVEHVSWHIPHLEVKENNDKEGVYACLWESCRFQSSNPKEIIRHVNFHSFHTKIKCIGSNILALSRQPGCTFIQGVRNQLPDFPHAFACCWDDCERTFNNSQVFFDHVQAHVFYDPDGRKVAGGVPCGWRGCEAVFRTVHRLEEHARRHTQEKRVGCPTCGSLFTNKVKFLDHCQRQFPVALRGYQCSHCGKCYPSKRLLADHMHHHKNNYQCSFCDMTCPSPSSLAVHIRYKHLDFKPFKCHTCDYAAKTQYDLNNHLATHSSNALHCCQEEGCDLSFRSIYGLRKHYRRDHCGRDEPAYCCHICDDLFQRGSLLTLHLKNMHGICRPSGHSRSRYKLGDDGYFRLVRAQPVQSQASSPRVLCGSSRYSLR